MSGADREQTGRRGTRRRWVTAVLGLVLATVWTASGPGARADGLDFLCSATEAPLAPPTGAPEVPQVLAGVDYVFRATFPATYAGSLPGATTLPDGSRVVERVFPLVTESEDSFFGTVVSRVFQPYDVDLDGDAQRDLWFQLTFKVGTFGLPADLQAQLRRLFHENFARPRDRVTVVEIDDVLGPLVMLSAHAEGWARTAPFRADVGVGVRFRRADGSLSSTYVDVGIDGTAASRWPTHAEVAAMLRADDGGDAGLTGSTNYLAVGERFDYGSPVPDPMPAAAASVEVSDVTGTSPLVTEQLFAASTGWSRAPQAVAVGARQVCPAGGTSASTGHLSWLRDPDPAATLDLDVTSGAGHGLGGGPELGLDATVTGVPRRLDWVAHPHRLDLVNTPETDETFVRPDVVLDELILATDDPADPADTPLHVTGRVDDLSAHIRVNALTAASSWTPPGDPYPTFPPGDPFPTIPPGDPWVPPGDPYPGPGGGPAGDPGPAGGPTDLVGARIRSCPILAVPVPPTAETPHPGDGRVVLPGESEYYVPARRPACDDAPTPTWAQVVAQDFLPGDPVAVDVPSAATAGPHVLYATRLRERTGAGAGGVFRIAAGLANLSEATFRVESPDAETTKLHGEVYATDNASAAVTVDVDDRTSPVEVLNAGSRLALAGGVAPLPSRVTLDYERSPGVPLDVRVETPPGERAAVAGTLDVQEPGTVGGVPMAGDALVLHGPFDVGPPGLPALWHLRMADESHDAVTGKLLTWSADDRTVVRARLALSDLDERSWDVGHVVHVDAEVDRHLTARWSSDPAGLRYVDARACSVGVACAATANRVDVTYVGSRPAPPVDGPLGTAPPVPDVPEVVPVPEFTPLSPGGEGLRVVDLTDATGYTPNYGYRAQVRNLARVTWERDHTGIDPTGLPAVFRRFCAVSEPTGEPFVTNVYLANGQLPNLYLDGRVDRLPAVLSAHLRPDAALDGPPRRRLLWFQTEDCDMAVPPVPPGDDVEDQPVYVFDLRQGELGLVSGVPRPPMGGDVAPGIDATLHLHRDVGLQAADVQGRVGLPRHLDVDVPSVRNCDEENLASAVCPALPLAHERDERMEARLAWRSSAFALGYLRAHAVLSAGAPTLTDPGHVNRQDVDAEIGRIPGSATVAVDEDTNERLPWDRWTLQVEGELKNGVPPTLETVRFALTDRDTPGYKGPWKPPAERVAPEDEANRVPNYQVRLDDVPERLLVHADLYRSESPSAVRDAFDSTESAGAEFCRRIHRSAVDRQALGYLDASVDLNDADRVDLQLRSGEEAANLGDNAQNALVLSTGPGSRVDGTVALKLASAFEESQEVDTFLTTSDFRACLDFDLPLQIAFQNVNRMQLGQMGAGFAVDLPDADRAAGADVSATVGETFRAPDGSDVSRSGAWYRHYYVRFDPEGPGDFHAWEGGTHDCTWEILDPLAWFVLGPFYGLFDGCDYLGPGLTRDPPGALSGWRDVPVHPLRPAASTRDCDEWPETDQCPLPYGGLSYQKRGWTNEFGYGERSGTTLEVPPGLDFPNRPAGHSSIAFLLDPLFTWEYIAALHERDDDDLVPGRPGRMIFEALRTQSQPAADFRYPYVTRSSRTDQTGQFVKLICASRAPATADTMTAADGTEYSVSFDETKCDETSWPTSPWTYWEKRVHVYVVARHPNGMIRWSRDMTPSGWGHTSRVWGTGRPLPRSRATVDLLLGDDGAVQARARFGGHDATWRLDPSGMGGPADRALSLGMRRFEWCFTFWGRRICVPFLFPGVVDAAPEVVVASGTETTIPLSGGTACGSACSGRAVFYGDGSMRRYGRDEPLPAVVHTWAMPGRYPLLVVTHDDDGRATGVFALRIRAT